MLPFFAKNATSLLSPFALAHFFPKKNGVGERRGVDCFFSKKRTPRGYIAQGKRAGQGASQSKACGQENANSLKSDTTIWRYPRYA